MGTCASSARYDAAVVPPVSGKAGAMQRRFSTGKFGGEIETFTLHYESLDSYFLGLDAYVGLPNPNLLVAMEREHCFAPDSEYEFTTPNYGITTKSLIEWWFVFDPKEGLQRCAIAEYPPEDNTMIADTNRRSPRSLIEFEDELHRKSDELEAIGLDRLKKPELIAARLYTGPCYVKYNGVLRGCKEDSPAKLRSEMKELTRGNMYVTTLHAINSAVVKLSQLSKIGPVFRGLRHGRLPPCFQFENEYGFRGGVEAGFTSCSRDPLVAEAYAAGPNGGGYLFECEQGMVDRGAELTWLSQYKHECEVVFTPLLGVQVLSEIPQGSPPPRGYEHGSSTRYGLPRHAIAQHPPRRLVVRLNTNRSAQSIEQVISRMRTSHIQLMDLLLDDLNEAEAPVQALAELEALHDQVQQQDAAYFNDPSHYGEATAALLEVHRKLLVRLADENVWHVSAARKERPMQTVEGGSFANATRRGSLKPRPSRRGSATPQVMSTVSDLDVGAQSLLAPKMHKCAALCARSGHPRSAAKLLLLASQQVSADTASTSGPHAVALSRMRQETMVATHADSNSLNLKLAGSSFETTPSDDLAALRHSASELLVDRSTSHRQFYQTFADENMVIQQAIAEVQANQPSKMGRLQESELDHVRGVLRAAIPCLREGLPWPWSSTLVALTGYGQDDLSEASEIAALSLAQLAKPLVQLETFRIGKDPVLAYDGSLQLWKHGNVTKANTDPNDELATTYDIETFGTNAYLQGLQSWQVLWTPPDNMEGGLGGLLLAAAASGALPLVEALLEVRTARLYV